MELRPVVLERHGFRSGRPSRLQWEEISAISRRCLAAPPAPATKRLLTILLVPQLLPAKPPYWERDPGLHSQGTQLCYIPTTKKEFSGALSAKFQPTSHFCHQVPVPCSGEGGGGARKKGSELLLLLLLAHQGVSGCLPKSQSQRVSGSRSIRTGSGRLCTQEKMQSANESSRLGRRGDEGCPSQREPMCKGKGGWQVTCQAK